MIGNIYYNFMSFSLNDCLYLMFFMLSIIQLIFVFNDIKKLNSISNSEESIKTITNYLNLYAVLSLLSVIVYLIYNYISDCDFERYKKSFKYLSMILTSFLIMIGIVITKENKNISSENNMYKIYYPEVLVLCPSIILILTFFGY
jgi:archaellum biogenesis protein FlaJ (TadC family)